MRERRGQGPCARALDRSRDRSLSKAVQDHEKMRTREAIAKYKDRCLSKAVMRRAGTCFSCRMRGLDRSRVGRTRDY